MALRACFVPPKEREQIAPVLTWPEQRRHVVVCLMRCQLANYSSGSFTWTSESIQLNFVGILKRCEKKNGAAERFTAEEFREQVAPSDFDEHEYETKWKRRRRVCCRPSRCARCRSPRGSYRCKLHALFVNHDEVKSGLFLRLKPWKRLIAGLRLWVQICTDLIQIEKVMTKMNDNNLSVITII